jgi:Zn-dependent M28 family amino/carboxypeptidase
MPPKSDPTPTPPLSAEEIYIQGQLARHIEVLAGQIGERHLWRYPALLAAADYLERSFRELGDQPGDEPFTSAGRTVRNLIVERPGRRTPERILVIGAHYDSVRGSPGANDNGSGVAALLELARLLAGADLAMTLRFVAFVNEEAPFFQTPEMGSLVHARGARARGERIDAMLALETIGFYLDAPGTQQYPFPLGYIYPDTANFIAFVGNLGSLPLVRRVLRAFRQATTFPAQGAAVPAQLPGVGWSDHWAFWQAGYRAIMVTDTAFYRYPHYHTPRDTPEQVDCARMARVVAGLARTIGALAA